MSGELCRLCKRPLPAGVELAPVTADAAGVTKRVSELLFSEFKGIDISTALHGLIQTQVRLVFTSQAQEGKQPDTGAALEVLIDALQGMKANHREIRGVHDS